MSSAQQLLLTAKRCDIDNLTHLATTCEIVGDISHFIHMLQRERGASTIFLVSHGARFKERRATYRQHSQDAEAMMRRRLEALSQEARPQAAARLLRRIATVWSALDELSALRHAIDTFAITPDAATQAFNQLTSGLLAIVFEAADTAVDPDITRALVAIFHLMQGKELAGQERACGAFGFTQGYFDDAHSALLSQLINDQQRCFDTFEEFASSEAQQHWQQELSPRTLSGIGHLRDIACQRTTHPETPDSLGETWYELTTLRIDSIKSVEDALTAQLTALCHCKIHQASAALEKAKTEPCTTSPAPCEQLLALSSTEPLGDLTASALNSPLGRSLIELTQAQSSRLQGLSDELENTRKALRERKLIERAKGLIMAHQNMTEEEAYRFLRTTSMNQSKSMADMAQSILDLSTMLRRKEVDH
ncbi:nitrate regulatory protein [Halomonas sp. HL-93]|uniref:nitrate regulatory protein n=1 Tax=Halomonas sp. HL-93 TaxID=1666906 RepID=UPI0006D94B49|nr:nitrate regulatory protein [Halomonas sp. HL-93]KPQ20527.1 MAG: nitrate/nitrate sensor/antiterminator regulatory system bifunctional RNA-binding antiterminator / sensor NasS-NasT [Halomonas sp. HL-93]SBR47076.1 ANTAR domain-containing protein [Halomonas sp. HL-93]